LLELLSIDSKVLLATSFCEAGEGTGVEILNIIVLLLSITFVSDFAVIYEQLIEPHEENFCRTWHPISSYIVDGIQIVKLM
jgi:hypothetical protein